MIITNVYRFRCTQMCSIQISSEIDHHAFKHRTFWNSPAQSNIRLPVNSENRMCSHPPASDATAEKITEKNHNKFNVLNFCDKVQACRIACVRVATQVIFTTRWRCNIFKKLHHQNHITITIPVPRNRRQGWTWMEVDQTSTLINENDFNLLFICSWASIKDRIKNNAIRNLNVFHSCSLKNAPVVSTRNITIINKLYLLLQFNRVVF